MTFRPVSYWDTPDAIFANIKGEQRRLMVERLLEEGKAQEIAHWMLRDELTDEERREIGSIDPLLMGGEYLPDYASQEVEIARVALRSSTGDVTSIRARSADGLIHYSVADEYETDYRCSPTTAPAPLTLGELITLIDTVSNEATGEVGLTSTVRDEGLECGSDPDDLVDFVRVSSRFYPELETYYAADAEEWLERIKAREDAEQES
jgi:hypothetical protein